MVDPKNLGLKLGCCCINIAWNDIFFMKSNSKNLNIPINFTTFSSKPITSEASNLARSSAALHSSCAFAYSILTDSSSTCWHQRSKVTHSNKRTRQMNYKDNWTGFKQFESTIATQTSKSRKQESLYPIIMQSNSCSMSDLSKQLNS